MSTMSAASTTWRTQSTIAACVDERWMPYRVVSLGIFLSLVWKLTYFRLLFEVYKNIPVNDDFFPAVFRSEFVLASAYVMAAVMSLWGIVSSSTAVNRFQSVALLVANAVLCWHQGSYNDVTFCTAFWASAWCVWYSLRIEVDDRATLLEKSAMLAHLIVAVIFLGGDMGKMTPGYWNGSVLYDIYFVDRDFWLFNALRQFLSEDQLHWLAMWYSRFVTASELTGAVVLVLLPRRWASVAGMVILCGVGMLSNFMLFSVLFSLIGLTAVGLLTSGSTQSRSKSLHFGKGINSAACEEGIEAFCAASLP